MRAELAQLGSSGNQHANDHASQPAYLFHLADAAGMDCVVRGGTLRAHDWRLGHDAALVGYGVDLVTDFLTARHKGAIDALREQFSSATLANFNPRGTHFDGFVARLFERIDAADPATFPGYALGLSVGNLPGIELMRAIYSHAQQLAIIESVYQHCEDYFVSAVQRFGERHSVELLPPCWEKFCHDIGTVLMRFRCPARVNEHEWIALAVTFMPQQDKDHVIFKIIDNFIVPTVECDIAGSLDIIAIGASLPYATTREALLAYLSRNRMHGVTIVTQQSVSASFVNSTDANRKRRKHMSHTTDSLSMSAARRYLRECVRFQSETGYSHGKANELLSALVVNSWLNKNEYKWQIEVESRARGVDGTMVGGTVAGPRDVEFKSSKAASFQFNPTFDYPSHGCIVMTQFKDGLPTRIFLAFGAESIRSIQKMAVADTERANFDHERDMALVHVTAKPGGPGQQRTERVDGLVDQLEKDDNNKKPNRFVIIEGEALAELLAQ